MWLKRASKGNTGCVNGREKQAQRLGGWDFWEGDIADLLFLVEEDGGRRRDGVEVGCWRGGVLAVFWG